MENERALRKSLRTEVVRVYSKKKQNSEEKKKTMKEKFEFS